MRSGAALKALWVWLIVALLSAPMASAQVTGKGDDASPPRDHGWTVRNGCNEPIWVAIRADGMVWGWQALAPGQEHAFRSTDTTIGVHARIGSAESWWAPGGRSWLEHSVDLNRSFRHPPDVRPAGETLSTFLFFDILRQPVVTVCGH